MRDMKVVCSHFNEQAQRIEIVREITNDDGSVEYNGLSIPIDKLESVSAMYEIDDMDELCEFVIYESLMDPEELGSDAQTIRQRRRNLLNVTKARLGPMVAANAKQNIKNRLRTAGLPDHFINAVDDDCVDVIKRHSRMDDKSKQEKKDRITAARNGQNTSRLPRREDRNDGRQPGRIKAKPKVSLEPIEMSGGKRVRRSSGQSS